MSSPIDGVSGSSNGGLPPPEASVAVKNPPPESTKQLRLRSRVVSSFWIVVVLLGLPVWWWTTSIHRASLPLQEMLEWADGKACKPTFPLQILIDAPALQESEGQHLVRSTQHALDDLNEFSAHHLRLTLGKSSVASKDTTGQRRSLRDEEVALTVRLTPKDGVIAASTEMQPHSTTLDVFYATNQIPSTSSSSFALADTIANTLQSLFAEEQASIAYILSSNQFSGNGQHTSTVGQVPISSAALSSSRDQRLGLAKNLPADLISKLARRATRSLKYAPTYHITLSLFSPTATPSSWDIESAIHDYLAPLLESFSISNFTVDTQVQLYAAFSPSVQQPEYDESLGAWTLRTEDLSGFINAAEWPLSPSIGPGPTLNFVLYVPDSSTTPLVVKESQSSGWLIPQWGGVFILNPPSSHQQKSDPAFLAKEAIQPALLTFSHQLLSLLGAPETPPSFPLQLQTLTRVRAASLLLSASSTMGSLARLTVALPSIAIPENVADAVDRTLAHLRATCTNLRDGRFKDAMEHARIAEAEAEKGFFEKSMVGQVYFPDEHKVAVYLPLLGPIGVPLVMSALKELNRLRGV